MDQVLADTLIALMNMDSDCLMTSSEPSLCVDPLYHVLGV